MHTKIDTDDLVGTVKKAQSIPGDKVGHIIPVREPVLGHAFCWHDTSEDCTAHAQELGLI